MILVPGGTWVPGAGACSRAVPLPVTCTSRPAAAATSITLRTGNPMSDGTVSFFPSLMVTCAGEFATAFDCSAAECRLRGRTLEAPWLAPGPASAPGAEDWAAFCGCSGAARSGSSGGRSLTAAKSALTLSWSASRRLRPYAGLVLRRRLRGCCTSMSCGNAEIFEDLLRHFGEDGRGDGGAVVGPAALGIVHDDGDSDGGIVDRRDAREGRDVHRLRIEVRDGVNLLRGAGFAAG